MRMLILKISDCLLSKENEKLPFARHVVGAFEHLHFIEDFISGMFMWSEKVIISNPESQVIACAVDVIKPFVGL